ncbi:FtsX-like permease family protein [Paenibacillus helianthi]|nr:FtsX-like permease family protein [Paenibacillus helianthi]
MLTLFELLIRGMRKNIKYYYLYYFALIFSTGLYFVFASLQNDSMVMAASSADVQFSTVFNAAGVLVITIVVIFMVYANSLFLKRRSREIGLYQVVGLKQRAAASALYTKYISGEEFSPDFDAYYKESLRKIGLIIFIAAFLGLVFLIFTGSILYFKQMTEAEQERKSYTILRQLGFGEREIMGGIIRKQMLVFALPLMVGLLHSIFAVKAASALSLSDLTFPAAVAMMAYTLIYFVFAVLTVGYYHRIVKAAL